MDINLSIKRTIYISWSIWCFKRTIEINDCNSKQDVINRMICLLEQFLNNEDLYKLKTKLEQLNTYSIFDYDFGDMLLNDQTYYICNHGCNKT